MISGMMFLVQHRGGRRDSGATKSGREAPASFMAYSGRRFSSNYKVEESEVVMLLMDGRA
jgi:hypothetical protein